LEQSINAVAIIVGSITGLLFSRGIPEHYKVTVQNGVGLSVVLIGVKSSLVADNLLVIIISIVIGSICGEIARIEYRLEQLGTYLETRSPEKTAATPTAPSPKAS